MASPQTTPLSQLLGSDDNRLPPPNQNPTGQFGQLPSNPNIRPITTQMPTGVGQGMSMPEGSSRKEFFGSLKDFDYKTVILVFAIILILSSGMFASGIQPYMPSAVSNGKTTLIGSLIAAIVGVLIFVVVKLLAKF